MKLAKYKYNVFGWYDDGECTDFTTADRHTVVTAIDESSAEDLGDAKFKRTGDRCPIITAELVEE